jgi:hypothetical protein
MRLGVFIRIGNQCTDRTSTLGKTAEGQDGQRHFGKQWLDTEATIVHRRHQLDHPREQGRKPAEVPLAATGDYP